MTPEDSRTPARASCQPATHRWAAWRVRTVSVQPGGSRGVAVARASRLLLWLWPGSGLALALGKAGKTGPQNPTSSVVAPSSVVGKAFSTSLVLAQGVSARPLALTLPSSGPRGLKACFPSLFIRLAVSRESAAWVLVGWALTESWISWQGGVGPVTRTVCLESDRSDKALHRPRGTEHLRIL